MYKYVLAGGGSASVVAAGHLLRSGRVSPKEILVIEPHHQHFYQPGFTMVGGGLLGNNRILEQRAKNFIHSTTPEMFHRGINIMFKEVTGFDPENNKVLVTGGESIEYQNLIVALGITLDYESIPGLIPALELDSAPVGSIYRWKYALKLNRISDEFKGGKAVFCIPNQPIKCAGAPQKVMHLLNDKFTKNGLNYNIEYYMAQPTIFSVPKYSKKLTEIAEGKGFKLFPEHLISRVDNDNRVAYFKSKTGEVAVNYDLLHVVPPQTSPKVLKGSKIADAAGFVDVKKDTLQHVKYDNIWSLGDCSNLPTSKTLAAAIAQSTVLVHNLIEYNQQKPIKAKYTGYTSCPVFVGKNKLVLCEFKYALEVDETFTASQDQPFTVFYWIKRYFFPRVYFKLMKHGYWYGRHSFFKPNLF